MKKYKLFIAIIIAATIIMAIVQHNILDNRITFLNFLTPFLGQLLAPAIAAAFIVGILWYLGRKINSKSVFLSYLICWIALTVFTTITVIKISP